MVSAFNSLMRLHKSLTEQVRETPRGAEAEKDLVDLLNLTEEIKTYLFSYKWLSKGPAKDRMRVYLESGLDYDVLCEQCNLSYEQAKNAVKWANKQFKKKIGENTLSLIKQGYLGEARAAFYMASGQMKVEKFVSADCYDKLPKAKFDIFSLADCEIELRILNLISKSTLQQYLSEMDEDKMAYLIYLLEGSSKKSDLFRPYLIGVMNNKISVDKLLGMENEIRSQIVN